MLNQIESLTAQPEFLLKNKGILNFYADKLKQMEQYLEELKLPASTKQAYKLRYFLTINNNDRPDVAGIIIKEYSQELRSRIEDELEGLTFFHVSDHVGLLSDHPPFGDTVEEAFPSARYDISEAGRCLALGRPTACVLHLMRALELSLLSLAAELGVSLAGKSWNADLNSLQDEIRSRTQKSHGEKWKNKDEPFFTEAATHFRLVKNAWRNHVAHGRVKFTDEEAEEIYGSVRSFMRHLSVRLSEAEQSS